MERAKVWRKVRNPLWSVAALVIVIAGLKAAGSVVVPFLVAVFLAIICAPICGWLVRHRVPNVLAVTIVILGLLALAAGAGAVFAGSINEFGLVAPRYQERLTEMARELVAMASRKLGSRQLGLSAEKVLSAVDPGSVMSVVGRSMNALASLLSDAVLVLLTMVFILLEAPTIPKKIRALAGKPDADISQFGRIAEDVQRYLAVKTLLATATGTLVAIWCAVLGIDFALLWGLFAFLANYIPNIGIIFAAVPAVLLAVVQYGPGRALILVAGYVGVGMVVGNMIEPAWLGRRLGLSTLVVFLSLVLWGWLWGWVGMLLSVPLTMVVKIMLESSTEWAPVAALLDGPTAHPPPRLAVALAARVSRPPAATPAEPPTTPAEPATPAAAPTPRASQAPPAPATGSSPPPAPTPAGPLP
jgi:AI-2 transport protein TqsA